MSLSHALSLAESVRRKLDCAKNDPANLAATPQEAAEGELEKAKVSTMSYSVSHITEIRTGQSGSDVLHRTGEPDPRCRTEGGSQDASIREEGQEATKSS